MSAIGKQRSQETENEITQKMPKKKTAQKKNPLRLGRPGGIKPPKKGDIIKGWEVIDAKHMHRLKKRIDNVDTFLNVVFVNPRHMDEKDKWGITYDTYTEETYEFPIKTAFTYRPKGSVISGQEKREILVEATKWADERWASTKRPRGTSKTALSYINRCRYRIGERPLDPIAAGWTSEDIINEAQRLGWKPRTNPKKKDKKKSAKYRSAKHNPELLWLSDAERKRHIQYKTDADIQKSVKKMESWLENSDDPLRDFGTEGYPRIKSMIKTYKQELRQRGIAVNPKKKAKKKAKKKVLKTRAKKVGRKAKKVAKTPTGRAAIGASIGALALGPIGAAGGAYAGLKLAPKKKRKKNPEEMVKISQPLGMMLADYYEASPNIEHAAAAGIRREKVEVSILKKARTDLVRLRKIQPVVLEREQIGEIIEALNRVIEKQERGANGRQRNPARAFELETEVKRGRQKKAKKAIGRSSAVRKAAGAAKSKSLRKRLAQINPDPTLDMLADKYAKKRKRHRSLVTSPTATEAQIERAKQKVDKAERELLIYAEVTNLDPVAFQRYLERYYRSKANSRRRS